MVKNFIAVLEWYVTMIPMLSVMVTAMMTEWLVAFFCATHRDHFFSGARRKLYSEYITEHNAEKGADVADATKNIALPILERGLT